MGKTMKHLIFIHLFLFIPQRKNLFLLSNLLLILSFTGCKSAIKEEGLTKIQKTKPVMTQNTTSHGELYPGYRNGLYNWYDKKQKRIEGENNRIFGKYEGEIRKGLISYDWFETFAVDMDKDNCMRYSCLGATACAQCYYVVVWHRSYFLLGRPSCWVNYSIGASACCSSAQRLILFTIRAKYHSSGCADSCS